MNPTRRGILSGSISSLILLSRISLSYIDSNYENYLTELGRFNIWQVQGNQWKLMVDSSGRPLEFLSCDDALDYCRVYHLSLKDNALRWEYIKDKEGITIIRPAPTALHLKGVSNLSAEEADDLMADWDLNLSQMDVVRPMLMSKDGGEFATAWLALLELSEKKQIVKSLQECKPFCEILRATYCGIGNPRRDTYHSILARLQTFYRLV